MIALHEGDASYLKNQFRGAQFYPNCVQIEVVGDGTVELPKGVSFPGAYDYSDPGVVFDVSLHSWSFSGRIPGRTPGRSVAVRGV